MQRELEHLVRIYVCVWVSSVMATTRSVRWSLAYGMLPNMVFDFLGVFVLEILGEDSKTGFLRK